MPVTMSNSIFIQRSPQDVFDFVSQPWLWHQWHPNSKSAKSHVEFLQQFDEFDEVIELQPLKPLPLRLTRQTHYRVEESIPAERWQVRGESSDGWLELRYRFRADESGTYFVRDLTFELTGISRFLMPFLHRQMLRVSELALQNLKTILEKKS